MHRSPAILRHSLGLRLATGLVAAAILLGLSACGRSPEIELVQGRWQFTPGLYRVGQFALEWKGAALADAQLSVRHAAAPDRELWATAPGQGFVGGAIGQEEVHEARGMFTIEDQLSERCFRQKIDSIEASDALLLRGRLECGEGEVDYTLQFSSSGERQLSFQLQLSDPKYNRSYLAYASEADEAFLGFGEQFTYVDMKGRKLPIFVMEQGIGRGAQPITIGADLTAGAGGKWHTSYAGVPHYITSALRSLFLENYEYSSFDMREDDRVFVEVFSHSMRGRILYGDSPAALVEEFTLYSGRMRDMPAWLHQGAVIGMQGGSAKVRDVYEKLRALDTPLAAFWLQDWEGQRITSFGKQLWWNWELDRERYPDWDLQRREFDAAGIRLMVYINPFLVDVSEKPGATQNLFKEALDRGYLIRKADGSPYLILNTDFSAGLIDLSNPQARLWIKDVIKKNLIGVGARGWMADFGEALPYDAKLHSGESPAQWHNRYPEEWAQVNREAIREAGLEADITFFSRSGYTRSPGATTLFWLGDQLVSWDEYDGIKTAVTGLLSSGFSGYSLNHSDIGGYTAITNPIKNYHRSKELLLRWIELSAFNAVFRTHEGNRPDENWQIYSDDETLRFFARFAKIFAALAPYRKQLSAEAAATGLPVVRHPWLHYPDDRRLLEIRYESFLLGRDFLMAPVLDEGEVSVEVYLPAGKWIHLFSGAEYAGGASHRVEAPLGQPAVFYRSDSQAGAALRAELQSQNLLN